MFSTRRHTSRHAFPVGSTSLTGTGHSAFSLVELLVVLGIIAVLVALLLTVIARSRVAAQSVVCTSNLRQIHNALIVYSRDNNGRFPDPYELDTTWEQMISPQYVSGDGAFRCGSDPELYPTIGSSYDWRDTPRAETTLAGKSMSDVNRYDAVIAFEALPSWHITNRMNVVRLDGAALSMDQDEALRDLRRPIRSIPTTGAALNRGRRQGG